MALIHPCLSRQLPSLVQHLFPRIPKFLRFPYFIVPCPRLLLPELLVLPLAGLAVENIRKGMFDS